MPQEALAERAAVGGRGGWRGVALHNWKAAAHGPAGDHVEAARGHLIASSQSYSLQMRGSLQRRETVSRSMTAADSAG